MLSARLRDAQLVAGGGLENTFATTFPFLRIDYIFLSSEFEVLRADVPRTPLTRVASDHYPVIAEVSVKQAKARRI
jgi:endonuclease/exonuclease/phosphatase family metal-dependent hydrolase